jgi:hypothetical protein
LSSAPSIGPPLAFIPQEASTVFLPLLGYERLTAMRSPTDCITEGPRLKAHHSSNRPNKMPPAVSDRGCPMRPRTGILFAFHGL